MTTLVISMIISDAPSCGVILTTQDCIIFIMQATKKCLSLAITVQASLCKCNIKFEQPILKIRRQISGQCHKNFYCRKLRLSIIS